MSIQHTYPIACPQCAAELDVELYDSINVTEAPLLRDALMANELNAVQCPHCGLSFRVDKRLLYNDTDRGVMIFCFPGSREDYRRNQEEFLRSMQALNTVLPDEFEPPAVHLVFSRGELVERIFMLEADLDERIIEYIKYLMYSRNLDRLNPAEKVLLFNAQDSTETKLCFVVQDAESHKLESVLEFDRSAYEGLLEMFESEDGGVDLLELFPGPYVSARDTLIQDLEAGKIETP